MQLAGGVTQEAPIVGRENWLSSNWVKIKSDLFFFSFLFWGSPNKVLHTLPFQMQNQRKKKKEFSSKHFSAILKDFHPFYMGVFSSSFLQYKDLLPKSYNQCTLTGFLFKNWLIYATLFFGATTKILSHSKDSFCSYLVGRNECYTLAKTKSMVTNEWPRINSFFSL